MPNAKKTKNLSVKVEHDPLTSPDYLATLADLKRQIQETQIAALISVNQKLIRLYWNIGKTIAEKQETRGWGSGVIEQLAKDLQKAFPGIEGYSRTNIFRMRAFYLAYQKVPRPVGQLTIGEVLEGTFVGLPISQIPWGHNIILLEKLKNSVERLWYAQKTIERGWSRSTLEDSIKADIYHREGKALTNFATLLPDPQSRLAQEILKDPYNFDFIALTAGYMEKELEQGLVDQIQKTLLELGQGFAFVGRQVSLKVGETVFYIDLLFFHLKLRCYVVVELKATCFKPEYAGKLNFYLSAVDDQMRHPEDRPTIGMLLCKTKDNFVVEYALRDINKPIGIAGYETKIMENLPKELKGSLPTVQEIEAELEKDCKYE